jgi:mRNA-degrading endonuclease YafQ of YafQ-DinJ toxin-antitoxin module
LYRLVRTTAFERSLSRLLRKQPKLRGRVASVLRDLESDPFQRRLHLHSLAGVLHGRQAVRADYSQRIVLALRVAEREIILIDIGSHDEVYR